MIEAGPVPRRPGGARRPTATRPSSSPSSRSPSASSRRPSSATWRRAASARIATSSSSAARSRRRRGETRHRRGLRARRHGQGRRHRHRQGLPGHDQAPQLPPRPEARTARTTSASRARSARRRPVARLQGHPDGRPHGRQARHPGRADRARGRRRAQPAARQGRRPGPEERHRRDQGDAVDGRSEGTDARRPEAKQVSLDEAVFAVEVKPHLVHEAVRAELNAARRARARRRAAGSSPAAAPSRGARRARAAPAPAPSARRTSPAAASPSRRRRARSTEGQPEAARAAPRCALSDHAQAGTLGVIDGAVRRRPRRRPPPRSLMPGPGRRPSLVSDADERSTSRSATWITLRSSVPGRGRGRRGRVGALARSSRQGALDDPPDPRRQAESRGANTSLHIAPGPALPGRLREELHAGWRPRSTRSMFIRTPTRRRFARRSRSSSRAGLISVNVLDGEAEAEAPRQCTRASGRAGRRRSSRCTKDDEDPDLFSGAQI